jgi:hypothetical protein
MVPVILETAPLAAPTVCDATLATPLTVPRVPSKSPFSKPSDGFYLNSFIPEPKLALSLLGFPSKSDDPTSFRILGFI